MEMADILRRHFQRLDKLTVQGIPGAFDLRLRHPQVLQLHAVEPLGIGFQGGKKMLDPEYNEMEWEFYHYYNTIPWDYVNDNLKQVYENESFVLFIKIT